MAVVVIGMAALACLSGTARGLMGLCVGALGGTLAAVGLVRMVAEGSPAAATAPAELMVSALAIGVVALGMALVAPYLTGALALAWTIGSVVGALAALDTGRGGYVVPLIVHAAVAAAVLRRCRSSVARRFA